MGLRTVNDPNGFNAPLVDKIVGTAYNTVKLVSDNLAEIKYIVSNMEAIIQVGQAEEELNAIAAAAPAAIAAAAAALAAATQAAAVLNGFLTGLNATGALVTPTGENDPIMLGDFAASTIAGDIAQTNALAVERTVRITTDTALQAEITAEVGSRVAVDNALQNSINVEAARAQVAEAAISVSGSSIAMRPVVSATTLQVGRKALLAGTFANHAPTTRGNVGDITTAFTGDLSQTGWPFAYTVTGTNSLGTPTTGYLYTPESSMYFNYMRNSSGWNQSASLNDGRTAATMDFTKIDQFGQGDMMAHVVIGGVFSSKVGGTSWLSAPAICAYIADLGAYTNHTYLNPIEINTTDNGYDTAAIGAVFNSFRNNHTASLGEPWITVRGQSLGTQEVDAFLSATGKYTIGLDLTTATLGIQQAAITLKVGQRVYFSATNGDILSMPRATNPTGSYMVSDGSNLVMNGGVSGGAIEVSNAAPAVTVVGALLVSSGSILPVQDNTWSLGGSINRWAQVFSAVGTINTSDANEKTNIEVIPSALLDAWDTMVPRAYKMISSVSTKGEAARKHTGYLAQDFAFALTAKGLVPAEWGAWCNDILTTGGSRQGLRYDEMFTIADAANRRKMTALEARLAALEAAGH